MDSDHASNSNNNNDNLGKNLKIIIVEDDTGSGTKIKSFILTTPTHHVVKRQRSEN